MEQSKVIPWAFFATILLLPLASTQSTTPVPKEYTNYRIITLCTPSDYVRYPTTAEDVQAIVQEAIDRNTTVKAFGARHSQTDVICTDGIPIDNHGLRGTRLNGDGTATIGAGVTLHEATEFLRQNGRAFKTTPAFGNITLGGAIGTGAHGSSIKYTSSISEQVVGLTIVDGQARILTISDEEDLKAFRVHLGLLGIVVDITLRTEPLYKTRAYNYAVGDEVLTNGTANKWAKEADQMSLYWFPSLGQVVVANWSIVDVNTPGDAHTYDHVPSTHGYFNLLLAGACDQIMGLTTSPCPLASATGYSLLRVFESYFQSTLLRTTPGFVPIYTEDDVNVIMPAVGYYDKMFAPTCGYGPGDLQCVWAHGDTGTNMTILDNEISLDLDDLPAFIQAVKDILNKAPAAFIVQGILMRFSANTTTYMSNSYGRNSVHFEWYMLNRQNQTRDASGSLAAYQTIMQTATKTFTGRSHWGKSGSVYHSTPMLDLKLNPTARAAFIAAMDKFDPQGRFMNKFGRRLRGTGTTQDLDPRATRCAMMDYCFCSKDSDCGATQTCTKLPGYNYPVCQTVGESRSLIPPAPVVPVSNLLDWVSNTLPGIIQGTLANPLCAGITRTLNLGSLVGR